MKEWLLPTLGAMVMWGCWGFLPKLTTQHLSPSSAIVYESIGAVCVGAIALLWMKNPLQVHPIGIPLAMLTGTFGILGALCFLTAVLKGSVTLVSTVSALYPVITIFLAMTFLHETITLKQAAGVVLAIASIILIAA
jgi:bacterial/archaeal transporter family protein